MSVPKMDEPVVYAIQGEHGGPVKVGYCDRADGVPRRLAAIQCGNPFRLVVRRLWPAPNGVADEKAAHEELAEFRMVGEWFMDCPRVAMRTGARLPKKGEDGHRYQDLVRSAYVAGMEAGAREAEKRSRGDWRLYFKTTLEWINSEDIDPECSESAGEKSARAACAEAGVPYPSLNAQRDAHGTEEAA